MARAAACRTRARCSTVVYEPRCMCAACAVGATCCWFRSRRWPRLGWALPRLPVFGRRRPYKLPSDGFGACVMALGGVLSKIVQYRTLFRSRRQAASSQSQPLKLCSGFIEPRSSYSKIGDTVCALDIYRAVGSTETANELRRMIHVGCGGGVARRRGGDARNAASGGVVGDEGDGGRMHSSTLRGEMCPQHPETRTTACVSISRGSWI